MNKETFRIDIDKRMIDDKIVKTTYSLSRCNDANFNFMTLPEVQLLINCLQNAIVDEKEGGNKHE